MVDKWLPVERKDELVTVVPTCGEIDEAKVCLSIQVM
jgi:hypothetical protein